MPISPMEIKIISNIAKRRNIQLCYGWNNFTNNSDHPKTIILNIENIPSLREIVSVVHEMNQGKHSENRIILRAAAGGRHDEHSQSFLFSSGAEADVIVRLVGKKFQKIESTPQNKIMRVGASVQMGDLDKELYEKYNLSLATLNLLPDATVAGLTANSESFCKQIKSIKFCLPNGNIVRVDDSHKDFDIIRGAHLGIFGIVLEMELECVDAMKMQCTMDTCTTPEFIQKIKSGVFTKYDYASAMMVPTYRKNALTDQKYKNVIIYGWNRVPKNTPDKNNCQVQKHLSQSMQVKLDAGLKITELLRSNSYLIPYYMRYLIANVAIVNDDSEFIGPWNMMHSQASYPSDMDDADYLLEIGKDHNEIIIAVEKIIHSLSEFAMKEQYPITDAIYFRVFNGVSGGLSTSTLKEGSSICGIDMVSNIGIPGYQEFKSQMKEYFIYDELAAKPHWGRFVPNDVDYKKMYGEDFEQFFSTLTGWYESHKISMDKNMLLNNFLCDILQMPYHTKYLSVDLSKTNMKCNVRYHSKKIAETLSKLIDMKNPEANNLLQRLQEVENEELVCSHVKIFDPSQIKDKLRIERTEDAACCNIL